MAKNITTKSVGRFAAWFAVLAIVEGCAEAPRTSDDSANDQVMGETKDARRDDACAGETAGSEESEAVPGDRGGAQAEQTPQSHREAEEDEGHDLIADAGSDAAADGADEPISTTMPNEPITEAVASSSDASSAREACESNACQHGATCSSDAGPYACLCPDGYTGQDCELKVCGSITIRSHSDVEENRECAEIRGDLTISSLSLTAIGADDFPFLSAITGDLTITGAQTPAPPHLESVTLAKLRAVNGAVVVLGAAVADFGASGPLSELHLPALERIGARGPLGLLVHHTNLRVLDLPALEAIEGGVALDALFELCTAELDNVEQIGGNLVIRDVPKIATRHFESLRTSVAGATSESMLGCCAPSSDDRVFCETFSESARALYCTGC